MKTTKLKFLDSKTKLPPYERRARNQFYTYIGINGLGTNKPRPCDFNATFVIYFCELLLQLSKKRKVIKINYSYFLNN